MIVGVVVNSVIVLKPMMVTVAMGRRRCCCRCGCCSGYCWLLLLWKSNQPHSLPSSCTPKIKCRGMSRSQKVNDSSPSPVHGLSNHEKQGSQGLGCTGNGLLSAVGCVGDDPTIVLRVRNLVSLRLEVPDQNGCEFESGAEH